ncbi:VCBS repeat-containing protein [Actinoplanes sp. NPDC049596]|uniref:FG-GAP repeat domain-containing protein n=1 Tax=unclassified Actinoplanes TaxID=2626549 RepID=UPI003412A1D7
MRRALMAAGVGLSVALVPGVASAATSGTFLPARYLSTGTTQDNAVAIADVTGDGRPDIVVGAGPENNTQLSAVLVYAQRADRSYGAPARVGGHGTWSDVKLATGDLDGDGRTDVALAGGNGVDVFYQRGGKLAAPVFLAGTAQDVAIADLNADGRRDVLTSAGYGEIRVYQQSAAKTFPAATSITGPVPAWARADQVFAADFNADGRLDVAQAWGGGAWVRLRQANGAYGTATAYQPPLDSDNYARTGVGAAVGDVTGDGKADLVVSISDNQPTAEIDVFAQQAGGLGTTPTAYPAYDIPAGLAIGDLTGDGRNDVVVAHSSWLTVSAYRQQSTGRLAPYTTNTVDNPGWQTDALALGDVTGDGKPDIVSVAYTKIAILQQR